MPLKNPQVLKNQSLKIGTNHSEVVQPCTVCSTKLSNHSNKNINTLKHLQPTSVSSKSWDLFSPLTVLTTQDQFVRIHKQIQDVVFHFSTPLKNKYEENIFTASLSLPAASSGGLIILKAQQFEAINQFQLSLLQNFSLFLKVIIY